MDQITIQKHHYHHQGKEKQIVKSKSRSQPTEPQITKVSTEKVDISIKSPKTNSINGTSSKVPLGSSLSSTPITNVWIATQQAQLEQALQLDPPS